MPNEKYIHISSSLIKEIASLGGDIKRYVPEAVYKKLIEKLQTILIEL